MNYGARLGPQPRQKVRRSNRPPDRLGAPKASGQRCGLTAPITPRDATKIGDPALPAPAPSSRRPISSTASQPPRPIEKVRHRGRTTTG